MHISGLGFRRKGRVRRSRGDCPEKVGGFGRLRGPNCSGMVYFRASLFLNLGGASVSLEATTNLCMVAIG